MCRRAAHPAHPAGRRCDGAAWALCLGRMWQAAAGTGSPGGCPAQWRPSRHGTWRTSCNQICHISQGLGIENRMNYWRCVSFCRSITCPEGRCPRGRPHQTAPRMPHHKCPPPASARCKSVVITQVPTLGLAMIQAHTHTNGDKYEPVEHPLMCTSCQSMQPCHTMCLGISPGPSSPMVALGWMRIG